MCASTVVDPRLSTCGSVGLRFIVQRLGKASSVWVNVSRHNGQTFARVPTILTNRTLGLNHCL